MAGRLREADEEPADVPMSPLIDCVFLLLIFFLVSTMMKRQDRDIDIDLPEAASSIEILPTDQQIVIGVDREARIWVDGAESSLTRLHTLLRQQGVDDPRMRIRLDADAKAPVHRVIEVLDLCQFNNLDDVWIRTYDRHYNKR